MSQPQLEGTIYVTDITLNVRRRSGKTLGHIILQSGEFKKEIPTGISPGNSYNEVFDPPLELSIQDRLSVSVQYSRKTFGGRNASGLTNIGVELSDVNAKVHQNGNENKRYSKSCKNIKVTIGTSSDSAVHRTSHGETPHATTGENLGVSHNATLLPTTDEIIDICPRFRLLVVGNTGVGKSTLIQKVFGVTDVDVSDHSRGRASVDQEFLPKDNGLFVLHDGLGLEAGDRKNLDDIKRFINERRNMENLKDRLHAVWVCLPVPYAKGRLLETGMEEFLRDRKQILGDIPVVVVLTKLDLLDMSLRTRGAMKNLEEARAKFLEEYCTDPLTRVGASDIPRVPVSTKIGFGLESTISDLVKATTSEIERHTKAYPSHAVTASQSSLQRDAPILIAGMAQRASIEEKINLTITLGEKRHWKNLSASLRFSRKKTTAYILVIHKEIIEVWNFNDPEMALRGDDFQAALSDTPDPGVRRARRLGTVLGSVTSAVKRLMAYIADLVYVLKILFVLVPLGSITSQDVTLALEVYKRSPYRTSVHLLIHEFDVGLAALPRRRDVVMAKIEDVLRKFSTTHKEVVELRSQIEAVPGSSTNVEAPTT